MTDDRQWRMHLAGKGRVVHLRPDNVGSTRAMLSPRSGVRGSDRLDRDGVVAVLRATYGDAGWETPRILAALDGAPRRAERDTGRHPGAFARYEQLLRPSTDRAQSFVPGAGHPRTARGVSLLRGMLRVMSSPVGEALYRIPAPPVTTVVLPDYPMRIPAQRP